MGGARREENREGRRGNMLIANVKKRVGSGMGAGLLLTAPEECSPQIKKLRRKPIPKTIEGYKRAVFHTDS